jgi:hypothetical protein
MIGPADGLGGARADGGDRGTGAIGHRIGCLSTSHGVAERVGCNFTWRECPALSSGLNDVGADRLC